MGTENSTGRQGIKSKWKRQDLQGIEEEMSSDTSCFCPPLSLLRVI